ncbi:MAG TPA: TonB-dependent receptor [Puia sp.]|jgi:TonB-linked SusC/RagA family outer membrane protein
MKRNKPLYSLFLLTALLLYTYYPASAQEGRTNVSGIVRNDEGSAVEAVTVVVKNARTGFSAATQTDSTGLFKFFGLQSGDDYGFTFSSVGYEDFIQLHNHLRPASDFSISVRLKTTSKNLNDVVVIGYGTIRRRDLTGSVAGIKASDIAQSKVNSFQEAMEGRIAGVQISSVNGQPGSAMNISIRGTNSVYGGSSPLFVIDGIPYNSNQNEVATETIGNVTYSNPLATMNPADIESIEVLKDASATAIYGSEGANGVVLVTTKAGKLGKAAIDYQGYAGFSSTTRKIPVLNGNDYIAYRKVVSPNTSFFFTDANGDGIYGDTVSGVADKPTDPYSYKQDNWQDELLRTGVSQNHAISVSGGNIQGTTYSASVSYLNQNAIILKNNYDRYTMRLRIDNQHGDKLRLGLNLSSGYSETNGATQSGGGTGTLNGVVQNLVTSRPVEFYDPSWDVAGYYISPASMINSAYKNVSLFRNDLSAYLDYKLIPDLDFRATIGGYLSSSKGKEFYPSNTDWGNISNGLGTLQQENANTFFTTDQFTYDKRFNENNHLTVLAGFEYTQYNYESFMLQATNFLDQTTGVNDISKGSVLKSTGSNKDGTRRVSYFGRVNYSLFDRHLFTVTLRADGSDKFGPGNRFGYFPSVAYAWHLSDEPFFGRMFKVVSDLKIRLSYGQTGNDRIPSWQYLSTLGNSFYAGTLGLAPNSFANPDLKWESTAQYNAGLDLSLFKDFLTITANYYVKHTTNMLIPANVPSYTGYFTQWQNLGRVDNTGFDLALTTRNIRAKNFQWQTDLNISSNRNKVINIGNVGFIPVDIPSGWLHTQGRVIAGQPIGTAYGYVFNGVYQTSDFTWQNNSDPGIPFANRTFTLKPGVPAVTGVTVQPGSLKFRDFNHDNTVDQNDQRVISRSQPKFFGGLNNTFKYKGFDLSFLFTFSYGNQVLNESKYQLQGGALNTWFNISQDFWKNHWTPDNPTNKYGTFGDLNKTFGLVSSYYVENAGWVRLQNVSLGYSLAPERLKKIGVNTVRLFFTGSNLKTWTPYTGYDPEVSSNQPLLTGYDRLSYPRAKSFVFGINASF